MKITVLNGSPKGERSVTLQYLRYLDAVRPGNELRVHHAAQRIDLLENDDDAFRAVTEDVRSSDIVVWSFPLYYMLVHGSFKRFIELLFERGAADAFAGKYAAAVSTSIHFFDHTAHRYIHGICDDLGMKFSGSYSAAMEDLTKEGERARLRAYWDEVLRNAAAGTPYVPWYPPVGAVSGFATPAPASPRNPEGGTTPPGAGVLIVHDGLEPGSPLERMTAALVRHLPEPPELLDISSITIRPCLGCCRCGLDNECVYGRDDEFIRTYETKVRTAGALVYAGTIRDRYLSARWKTFFDRSFYLNHRPSIGGKRVGLLVAGPLRRLDNLRDILESYFAFQNADLAGIVTDEGAEAGELDRMIASLADGIGRPAAPELFVPRMFPAVAGMKIFRDAVWGRLRPVFRMDHLYYRSHGLYDFPQKDVGRRIRNALLGPLLRIPAVKRQFGLRAVDAMVQPFRRVVRRAAGG